MSYVKELPRAVPTTALIEREGTNDVATPAGVWHTTVVLVVQDVVVQVEVPTCTLGVKSLMPKLVPNTEREAPAVLGAFTVDADDATGESKLNIVASVPMKPASPTAALWAWPDEALLLHTSVVAAVHEAVVHAAPPMYAVRVRSLVKKFKPDTVIVVCPLAALLRCVMWEVMGALNENCWKAVPKRPYTLMVADFDPVPTMDEAHTTDDDVDQDVVAHPVVPIDTEGVISVLKKLKP